MSVVKKTFKFWAVKNSNI